MFDCIPALFLLVIAIVSLLQRSSKLRKEMNVIAIYCLLCMVIELLILFFNDKIVTQTITITFKIAEYFIFATLANLLFYNRSYLKVLKIGALLYSFIITFCLINYHLFSLYSITATITAIFLLSYCILVMYDWISLTPLKPIYERPEFWLVLGFLIYEAGNYFNFIVQEIYVNHSINLHSVFATFRNCCFVVTLVMLQMKNKKVLKRFQQIR